MNLEVSTFDNHPLHAGSLRLCPELTLFITPLSKHLRQTNSKADMAGPCGDTQVRLEMLQDVHSKSNNNRISYR